ncbi:MAG: hypothetical protein HY331_03210 [Chloroflexi bacterium]|nr:hypothetical protein [Chloroflexota bacterium]
MEIARAFAILSESDPVGVLRPPTREEVAHVAVYLHVRRGRIWIPNPVWRLIVLDHPAARALYYHEIEELEGFRHLGVRNPQRVRLGSDRYWEAHARASWEKSRYWAAWAAHDGAQISAEAFLLAHPLRAELADELERILGALKTRWKMDIRRASVLELEQARRYYRDKELVRPDTERWLLR